MSTELKYDPEVVSAVLAFSRGMIAGEPGRELVETLRSSVERVSPHDVLRMEEIQLQTGIPGLRIKQTIGKVLNVLYPYLDQWEWERPGEHTFLGVLMAENTAFRERLDGIKGALKETRDRTGAAMEALRLDLLGRFRELRSFAPHYVKKENLLFPLLERTWVSYRPLKVMWSLHDDIRRQLELVIGLLEQEGLTWDELKRPLGDYFFLAIGMIHKEERIVFPAAVDTVSPGEWAELHRQSFEYAFPFIAPPVPAAPEAGGTASVAATGGLVRTPTGTLEAEQLVLLLDALPVDVTFVDHEDRVRYFSRGRDRIFPRSPAIIGRDVRNCHPPESVHVVEEILAGLRSGEKDHARFWLQLGTRFVVIEYHALRTAEGEYRGVLEVSQDASGIRALEGERRLLDW